MVCRYCTFCGCFFLSNLRHDLEDLPRRNRLLPLREPTTSSSPGSLSPGRRYSFLVPISASLPLTPAPPPAHPSSPNQSALYLALILRSFFLPPQCKTYPLALAKGDPVDWPAPTRREGIPGPCSSNPAALRLRMSRVAGGYQRSCHAPGPWASAAAPLPSVMGGSVVMSKGESILDSVAVLP
jgi:hypothetical protein